MRVFEQSIRGSRISMLKKKVRREERKGRNKERKNNHKILRAALAGVAQWIVCQPANQRVTGSTPSQGTGLGCGPGPQWGVYKR